jgi:LacI family transcriptional regulator
MATAKSLAEDLGVSIATISRALNGKPGISPKLREHILNEAARRHTFITPAARMLATSRTQNVCFAIYHLPGQLNTDPFYFEVLRGMEEEIKKAGLNLILEMLTDDEVREPANWRIVREHRADGVILIGPFIPKSFIIALANFDIPIVLIDNHVEGVRADSVVADDRQGARLVAEHAISLGHRKVSILSGPSDWYSNSERIRGFKDAFLDAGLPLPEVVNVEDTTQVSGRRAAMTALKSSRTALLAVNDAMAMGAIEFALEKGISVPNELSVAGFDDVEVAASWKIPLTTVAIPKNFIGRSAGRLLWARLEDKSAPVQRIDVRSNLIIRESTSLIRQTESTHQKGRGKKRG